VTIPVYTKPSRQNDVYQIKIITRQTVGDERHAQGGNFYFSTRTNTIARRKCLRNSNNTILVFKRAPIIKQWTLKSDATAKEIDVEGALLLTG
jgi:hypothetical protein